MLLGDDLMTDHLHPSLDGYLLMGKEYYDIMQGNNLLPKTKWLRLITKIRIVL